MMRNEHNNPENEIIRLKDHLPPEHTAYLETDPVVAFLHTVSPDGESKGVMTLPLVPNSTGGGFVELLDMDQKIIATTPAKPGGKMYSLYIDGPVIDYRYTIGYSLAGQTPIDWEARAVDFCSYITRNLDPVINMLEAGEPPKNVKKALSELYESERKVNFLMKVLGCFFFKTHGKRPGEY